MKLSEANRGDKLKIVGFSGEKLAARLLSMGMEKGSAVTVIRAAGRHGGMIVEAADALVALRKETAEQVEVARE